MRNAILFFLTALFFQVQAQTPNIDSLELLIKHQTTDTIRVCLLLELARTQSFTDSDGAFVSAKEALKISQKRNYKSGQIKAYVHIAYYYDHSGKSIEAIDALHKGLKISEEINNNEFIATNYNLIGLIYLSQDDWEVALEYFTKALRVWRDHNNKLGIAMALENIGVVYTRELKDSLALSNYMESLRIAEEANNKFRKGSVLNAIGKIYARSGEYHKSLEYQKRALVFAEEVSSSIMLSRVYSEMSNVFHGMGQYNEALLFAQKSLKYSSKQKSQRDIADAYYSLFNAYKGKGNYRKALEYVTLFNVLNDSLKNSKNLSVIRKNKNQYELDKKELEIRALQQEKQIEIFKRNTIIGIFALSLIILFLIYKRKQLITEKRLSLKKQQLELNRQRLIDSAGRIVERTKTIEMLTQQLELLKTKLPKEDIQFENFNLILQQSILTEEDWKDFKSKFDVVYPGFFVKLRYHYSDISEAELRIAALLKLKLSLKESASILAISPESVRKARYRFKKKMGLSKDETINTFIENLAVS